MSDQRDITRELETLRRQLSKWREYHAPPTPLPTALWAKAATLAAEHGVGRIARALGLDHAALKRRVEKGSLPEPSGPHQVATFVEWFPPATDLTECVLEVQSRGGARMRVEVKNVTSAGLASIVRDFAAV